MPYHWRRYAATRFITDEMREREATVTSQDWGLASSQILDQSSTPHCVGFGEATWHNCLPVGMPPYGNDEGHQLYYEAVAIGVLPNTENGATTEWGAKALRARGMLKTYAFATSVDEIITWILTTGPVTTGLMWTTDMARPDSNGIMHTTESSIGGHFTCWTAYDKNTGLFKCANSWGTRFGKGGFAWMSKDDMAKQLDQGGDCCLAVELPKEDKVKSKLGMYLINTTDLGLDWWRCQPRGATSMCHNRSYWEGVKALSPNTIIVGRYYKDDENFSASPLRFRAPTPPQMFGNPIGRAEAYFAEMLPFAEQMRGLYSYWMAYNEPVINSVQDAQNLNAFTVRWSQLMHQAGFKTVAYSFGVGNPGFEYWPYLLDGLRACDVLGLHEYSAPEMSNMVPWLCLRYRTVRDTYLPADLKNIPIIVEETGIDGGPLGPEHAQKGWRCFGNESHYLHDRSLQWYDNEIQKDPQVLSANIFAASWDQSNCPPITDSFGIAHCNSIWDYIASGGPAPEPPPAEPTCTGTPVIEYFKAEPELIEPGQTMFLSWGAVTNAERAEIDQEIGGVATPGAIVLKPTRTTTYTLTAKCGTQYTSKSVTVKVEAAPQLTLEEKVRQVMAKVPLMPVNNGAALWLRAKALGLQDQQCDEIEFQWNGETYICQAFNLGVLYCKKSNTDEIWFYPK